MQAPPSTLSCAALQPYGCSAHSLRGQSHHSLTEENALSSVSYPAGGFSNSELRMPNTAESDEYRPSDVTADFRHCQVGSRQFRSQYFSASKSSIKRAQIFFLYIFHNHRGITVSFDALCFEKWKFVEPRL